MNDRTIIAKRRTYINEQASQRFSAPSRIIDSGDTLGAPSTGEAKPLEGRGGPNHKRRSAKAPVNGDDTDYLNFLVRGWRAGRSVCCISSDHMALGTGFIAAPGVIMTNNHVLASPQEARGKWADFDFELDVDGKSMTRHRFALAPDHLFVTSSALDFTLVAAAPRSEDGTKLTAYGWLPLSERTEILEGEPIVIIQHPLGQVKRICIFNSVLIDRTPPLLRYTTDTEVGSSGAPALNRHWQVVGLHHSSVDLNKRPKERSAFYNEGIPISAIVTALRDGGAAIEEFPVGAGHTILSLVTDPKVQGRPALAAPVIGVTVGDGTGSETLESAATIIRDRDAKDLSMRGGYDPAFLAAALGSNPTLHVPLPTLPDHLAADATRLTGSRQTELKYCHYSVVMSRSRRLALFSAVNLDGATLAELDRRDRNPDQPLARPEAAADIWYYDPRIGEKLQLPPELYDQTAFDFGHLTRRLDPVWGSDRDRRLANDDTFFMTNCAPQHQDLNRKIWLRLEEATYGVAKKGLARLTVISGPVLDPRDPEILGVLIPTSYWKIIAFVDNERLVAQGFLQDQSELVHKVRRRLEGLLQPDVPSDWRISILDIGRMTNLNFGPLVAADAFAGLKRKKLTEPMIDRLFGGRPA